MLHDLLHRLIDLFEYKRSYQHESSGLKPAALHILEFIHKSGPIQTLDLGKQCNVPPATLIAVLDKLENRILIIRERSRQDKRVVMVRATPVGAALVALHEKEDRLFQQNIMKSLEAAEQKTFASILKKMLDAIDSSELFKE